MKIPRPLLLVAAIIAGLYLLSRLRGVAAVPAANAAVVDMKPALYQYPAASSIRINKIPLTSRLWGTA